MKPISDYTKFIAAIITNLLTLFGLDALDLPFVTQEYIYAAATVINGVFVFWLRNTKDGKPLP